MKSWGVAFLKAVLNLNTKLNLTQLGKSWTRLYFKFQLASYKHDISGYVPHFLNSFSTVS